MPKNKLKFTSNNTVHKKKISKRIAIHLYLEKKEADRKTRSFFI